ncbi:MAG TPA: arsenite methyltransferase [Candidatus Sulfomarinibacteraceae bacterium]|nr:arsenite methyltransferase [Candidatus Sulfomarinibacteraceae bacterium]
MTMMEAGDIHVVVREHYGKIAQRWAAPESGGEGDAACGCGCDDGRNGDACCDSSESLYELDVAELPAEINQASLGCGDPVTLAQLQPGQVVLDLGSGAGMDAFLAARRVSPGGRVIGVDMTPAMLEKANANKERLSLENVEFRQGYIEALPVDDNTVDVVISNCVINLSPDKAAVFREAFRVLRPGGRLAVSDMVTQGHFGPQARADAAAWAGCITGAEDVADYVAAMRAAGFKDISVRDKGAPEVELAGTTSLQMAPRLFSARITARKPA